MLIKVEVMRALTFWENNPRQTNVRNAETNRQCFLPTEVHNRWSALVGELKTCREEFCIVHKICVNADSLEHRY